MIEDMTVAMHSYARDAEKVRAWYVRGLLEATNRYGFEDEEKQQYEELFDRWFAAEIEKAERRGEVLATAQRIASENAELMRRLAGRD